jgi:hypothetical protein
MRFRARRRNIVVWRTSTGLAGRYGGLGLERAAPARPIRRRVRIGAMLALIGLLRLGRTLRVRWYMSAGIVLTVAGVIMRGSQWNFVLLPGLLLLLSTPLIPASPEGDRKSRSQLARELASYSTPAQRCDLEAILARYPDSDTRELRGILAGQFMAGCGIPGAPHRR